VVALIGPAFRGSFPVGAPRRLGLNAINEWFCNLAAPSREIVHFIIFEPASSAWKFVLVIIEPASEARRAIIPVTAFLLGTCTKSGQGNNDDPAYHQDSQFCGDP